MDLDDQRSMVDVELKRILEQLQRIHAEVVAGRSDQGETEKVHDKLLFDTVRDTLSEIGAVARSRKSSVVAVPSSW